MTGTRGHFGLVAKGTFLLRVDSLETEHRSRTIGFIEFSPRLALSPPFPEM